jgi:AcrR family transcriptional regulator
VRTGRRRIRARLITAAGGLFDAGGAATMADVAEAEELSTATAYQHFTSMDEILLAYRFEVGRRLFDFSHRQEAAGLELLSIVCAEWVRMVVRHGGSMVQTRSAEGYLARMRDGTCYLTVQAEALRRPWKKPRGNSGHNCKVMRRSSSGTPFLTLAKYSTSSTPWV